MNSVDRLKQIIIRCTRCSRLVRWREQVGKKPPRRYQGERYWAKPLPGFGDFKARLLIVGLAPAAHGGNRTGRIFTGDQSGNWLYEALYRFGFSNQPDSVSRNDGLKLKGCYITAAVRCAPPANKPARAECEKCRPYLVQELKLLKNVRVVLVLGKIAFDSYLKAYQENGGSVPKPRPQFRHGGSLQLRPDLTLIASYHPSQQNTFTGKLTREMFHAVFTKAREFIR
ncbi:MAG: uracil-DNA glycosylase [Deltaproteobacteria bacterium]|nr:uracil-DNA glycosylase [Deltaproteobacteria bacterium]MBI3059115.1 uracil-DNA glycosylase [Deltaproteobacteria bacterium]